MTNLNAAIRKIEQQQPKERTAVWMVGEQLKDLLRREPQWAGMVAQDLDNEAQTLAAVEKKIKAFADKHKSNGFACVLPHEAEKIIREVYGIPEAGETVPQEAPKAGNIVSLEDFF